MAKNYENGAIESKEVELGKGVKLVVSVKLLENKKFLDVRKWYMYPNQTEYMPSRKGLMMAFEDWKKVLPRVKELLEEYADKAEAA